MQDFIEGIIGQTSVMTAWEGLAVVLAIAYLLLAMRESRWCWYAAFISTAIYTVLFWQVSLLMESVLNVYYMAMAVYGWSQWRRKDDAEKITQPAAIHRWRWPQHVAALAVITGAALVSGYLIAANTEAALPYLDSFTTWGSVVTTFMVVRKVLENWIYWFVIDVVSIFLYLDRGLYLTAALFAAYTVMVVFGFFAWRKAYLNGA